VCSALWLIGYLLFSEIPALHASVEHRQGAISLEIKAPWWDSPGVIWVLLLIVMVAATASLWALILRLRAKSRELDEAVDAKRKSKEFELARIEVLEAIARNAPLPETVELIALAMEHRISGSACVVATPSENRSLQASEPSTMIIAPRLGEDVQAKLLPVLSMALRSSGARGDVNPVEPGKEDFLVSLLDILRQSGLNFGTADQSAVTSWNSDVAALVILLFKDAQTEESQIAKRRPVLWASRLVSLAVEHSYMHERLLHQARHDSLTGLPNRAVAEDRLEQALARAQRHTKIFAVLCMDLDGFKIINDEFGHDTGDEVLRAIAGRLRTRTRHSDTLARIGGDEFWAILEDCSGDAAAETAAESLITVLEEPVSVIGRQLRVSASIGIAMYPADGANASQLKRHADQAMYRAKSNGGKQIAFWSERRALERKALGLSAKVL
jgi:diguanylate cyclase (GGDEF)-like protein